MKKPIFIGRLKNDIEDRDAVLYTEIPGFECNHYFGGLNFFSPNFNCSFGRDLNGNKVTYQDLETDLSREEYETLLKHYDKLNQLGYGIKKGSKKYLEGQETIKHITDILSLVEKTREAGLSKVFLQIQKSEQELMAKQFNLSQEEVKTVIAKYPTGFYWDKGIICQVYDDYTALGENYLDNIADIPGDLKEYFDYKRLGENIAEENNYLTLSDGRIIEYAL